MPDFILNDTAISDLASTVAYDVPVREVFSGPILHQQWNALGITIADEAKSLFLLLPTYYRILRVSYTVNIITNNAENVYSIYSPCDIKLI